MKPVPSVHLGRAFALIFAIILLTGFGLVSSAAQSFGRVGLARAKSPRKLARPLRTYRMEDLPLQRIVSADRASLCPITAYFQRQLRGSPQVAAARTKGR